MTDASQVISNYLVSWADPERAAKALLPNLRADTAERLLRTTRTAMRTARLLAASPFKHYPRPHLPRSIEDITEPADRTLLLAQPSARDTVAVLAGAVWHAPRVRALVSAHDVNAFIARHGITAREIALKYQALAPQPNPTDEQESLDLLIRRDSATCLAAWAAALPEWAADWLYLAGGPAVIVPPDPATQARAAAIMRACAASIADTAVTAAPSS